MSDEGWFPVKMSVCAGKAPVAVSRVKAAIILSLAGLLGASVFLSQPGCGTDHTAGVVFDDGPDDGPLPTLTPPQSESGLLRPGATPTASPQAR